jgi:transcriptional regulator with XRE-family HTH domain
MDAGKTKKLRGILAANLKTQRKILGLSQEKLAEMANLSWQTVNSIECRRTWVSDATLERLASALKVDTYQLLLPIKDDKQPSTNADEALIQLRKAKRAFDDAFVEIVNSVK